VNEHGGRSDANGHGGTTVPDPIPQQAPGGFAAAEPLPDLIRRIVREELRPIHVLVEELRDRSPGHAGGAS
jgi:hypothetical protein